MPSLDSLRWKVAANRTEIELRPIGRGQNLMVAVSICVLVGQSLDWDRDFHLVTKAQETCKDAEFDLRPELYSRGYTQDYRSTELTTQSGEVAVKLNFGYKADPDLYETHSDDMKAFAEILSKYGTVRAR